MPQTYVLCGPCVRLGCVAELGGDAEVCGRHFVRNKVMLAEAVSQTYGLRSTGDYDFFCF